MELLDVSVDAANSVIYCGGNTFSVMLKVHKKRTVTALIKQQKSKGVPLTAMYGTPEERAAKLEAAKSAAKLHPNAKVNGKATRVPVSNANGFLTEKRFRENLETRADLLPNVATGDAAAGVGAAPDGAAADAAGGEI